MDVQLSLEQAWASGARSLAGTGWRGTRAAVAPTLKLDGSNASGMALT